MPSKRSKFLAPPEELAAVIDHGSAILKRKKKIKVKLMRQEHEASPHFLNLKDTPPPAPPKEILPEPRRDRSERPPFAIYVDAEKTIRRIHEWYFHWKSTLAFLGIGLLCVITLRAINWLAEVKRQDYQVLAQSLQGVDLMRQGTESLFSNPNDAAVKFQSSLRQLLWAKEDLTRFKSFHLSLLGEKKIDAALSLARAFREITVGLHAFLLDAPNVLARVDSVAPHLAAAEAYAKEADRLVPGRAEISELKQLIVEQRALLDDAAVLLGKNQWQRYLVLFQNNTELRATGGFIGSFAIVDVDRGKIKNIEIPKGGSYDLQGQETALVAPPQPLQLVKARWEFQDSNWFPDFPASAKKISWFYENAASRTVDGVIAINTNVMTDLLAITGPIPMPQYQRTIDSDNFLLETQKLVELEYDKTANTPKAFIGDLAAAVLARLEALPRERYSEVALALLRNVEEKNISVYSADAQIEQHLAALGLAGEMHQTAPGEDYLGIVHTNIAGQKTDQSINETVEYNPVLAADGSITAKLTISRAHEGVKGALFSGVRNVDYVRVYVPAGATLVSATGFELPPANLFKDPKKNLIDQKDIVPEENAFAVDLPSQTLIYNQFGKTVFANWLQVDPGGTTTAVLTYRLPFRAGNQYSLFVQKQSGMRPQNVSVRVQYNNNEAVTANDALTSNVNGQTVWNFKLEQDTSRQLYFKPAIANKIEKQ